MDSDRLQAILTRSGRTSCVVICFADRSAPGHPLFAAAAMSISYLTQQQTQQATDPSFK